MRNERKRTGRAQQRGIEFVKQACIVVKPSSPPPQRFLRPPPAAVVTGRTLRAAIAGGRAAAARGPTSTQPRSFLAYLAASSLSPSVSSSSSSSYALGAGNPLPLLFPPAPPSLLVPPPFIPPSYSSSRHPSIPTAPLAPRPARDSRGERDRQEREARDESMVATVLGRGRGIGEVHQQSAQDARDDFNNLARLLLRLELGVLEGKLGLTLLPTTNNPIKNRLMYLSGSLSSPRA
ncbi:LOW QUALITY PROTEIN: hypothetical protein RTBOTA2_000801 [Rhodotorula toruloides]|nr:LOW QUALITY PROTEIN: hypothetical protein RTBOTA2_000801 [Rhodotorula toruloides]